MLNFVSETSVFVAFLTRDLSYRGACELGSGADRVVVGFLTEHVLGPVVR